jgi:3'-phosphoadenosine 5'-phosphosulfate sulfotransferase (PAPS reductase)/FAD synthetase
MIQQLSLYEQEPVQPASLTDYDWIVISSSAGKDSLAMLDFVTAQAQEEGVLDRVVVVHCDLGRVEWQGTRDLAEQQAERYGVRFIVVWRHQGDLLQHIESMGFFPRPSTRYCTSDHKRDQIIKAFTSLTLEAREGDLLEQVEQRGMWPDPKRRYCTSDQKRAPVHKLYTALSDKTRQETHLSRRTRKVVKILSCQGMRAQESPARAKRKPFCRDDRASNGRRQVDNWLPLHQWTEREVWQRIRESRCADLVHPAYALGMPRLSCCFCIFAPKAALVLAGRHNPELLAEYVRVEAKIGHKFRLDVSMADVAEAAKTSQGDEKVDNWKM